MIQGPKRLVDFCLQGSNYPHHPWTWLKLPSDLGLITFETSWMHSGLKYFWGTVPNARPAVQIMGNKHRFTCVPPSPHLRFLPLWRVGFYVPSWALFTTWWVNTLPGIQTDLGEVPVSLRHTTNTDRTSEGQADKWPCYFLLSTWPVTQPLKQRKGAPARPVSHRVMLVLPGTLGLPGDQKWWIICLMSLPSFGIKPQIRNYYNLLFPTIKYRNYYFNILFGRTI